MMNGNISGMNLMNGMSGVHGMSIVNGNGMNGMNGHLMDTGEIHPAEMAGEEGLMLLDQGVWDLDGMLWGNLPDGLDMPYDGFPNMDFDDGVVGFDPNYLMHQ
jgi:hypothetical protein